MQRVAREMNLSETAFLVRRGDGDFDLRWFTPAVEVDLCGHATLASAHVLWEEKTFAAAMQPAVFHTRSGRLSAELRGGWIEMDFPAEPAERATAPDGLAAALGRRAGLTLAGTVSTTSLKSTRRRPFRGSNRTSPVWRTSTRAGSSSRRERTPTASISYRAFSPREPASTRIPSPGRPTVASDPTGEIPPRPRHVHGATGVRTRRTGQSHRPRPTRHAVGTSGHRPARRLCLRDGQCFQIWR